MMPFPGGIADTSNGTLIFAILLAVFYGIVVDRPPSMRRTIVKTGSVLLLALLAYLQGGPALLVAALVLSAAGDAFLAQEGEQTFLGGLASFLLAHVAYVALFWTIGEGIGPLRAEVWRMALAAVMVAAVALLLRQLWPAVESRLRGPVVAYAAAILAMGVASLTLPLPLAILGAVLFMASDALLATGRFLMAPASPQQAWVRPTVWALYFVAQVCITLAFVA